MSTVDLTIKPPATFENLRSVSFADVKIGQEFWWGSYYPRKLNWGRKRTVRTADYRPCLSGELTTWKDWGYFKKHETVYIVVHVCGN